LGPDLSICAESFIAEQYSLWRSNKARNLQISYLLTIHQSGLG
jgi:hypothetical protein